MVLQICNAVLLAMLNKCLKSATKLSEIEGSGFYNRCSVYIMSKFRNVQFVVATAASTLSLWMGQAKLFFYRGQIKCKGLFPLPPGFGIPHPSYDLSYRL